VQGIYADGCSQGKEVAWLVAPGVVSDVHDDGGPMGFCVKKQKRGGAISGGAKVYAPSGETL